MRTWIKGIGLVGWFILWSSGCTRPPTSRETAPPGAPSEVSPSPRLQVTVVLYFPDADYKYLVRETRRVPVEKATPQGRLELLLQGPREEGHEAVLASDLEITGVVVSEGTATVSLPDHFERDVGSENTALLALQSIVYTLTERDDIQRVQFLIGGRRPTSFMGALDLSGPQRRDETLWRETGKIAW